jgi:geranylgeranyl reductase family protein
VNRIDENMFDVIIIGAGPAGCATALALQNSGLRVALIDKHIFPRDKVCGDAIPGRAITCLKEIYPLFSDELAALDKKLITKSTACFYNNKKVEFNWVQEAYTSARMDFDNLLFSIVKNKTNTEIFENTEIKEIVKNEDGFVLQSRNNKNTFKGTFIIGADGINGITAKKLAGYQIDRNHHVASVRAYYKNVDAVKETRTEIYFDKKYLPGYFWIFPLKDNVSNVGFGMLSEDVAQKKINIKKSFYDFIERSETLKNKFHTAEQDGGLMGCGLPLGSKWVKMSGAHFILTGDAASLIDPASGSGIGNAVLSGKLAAEQVKKCFAEKNFSADFIKVYDKKLYKIIGAELKRNGFALKYLSRIPFFINLGFTLGKNNFLKKFVK